MNQKSQLLHDSTLVVRLPKALHAQLEQVATAQYMKMGELVRNLIKAHVAQAQPFLGATPVQVQTPQPKPTVAKPSQRTDFANEYERLEAKARYEAQEAAKKAKTEAYLTALRNGGTPPEEDDPWA